MPSSVEIRVPRETVNDDVVTIAQWHAKPGDRLRARDVLVSIETSKAVLEVEAGADGFLEILHPEGAEVPVGELIGFMHAQPIVATASGGTDGSLTAALAGAPQGATISRKAQALIDEHGIDADAFAGRGLVRESDVIEYLQARQQDEEIEADQVVVAPADTPGAKARGRSRLSLLGDLKVSAGERGASPIKLVLNYFWRNWLLGNLARWAPRGVLIPIHRLRGVKIGKGCFIDPTAIIETAFPENVTLGDDVRITASVVIMTHIKAPHYLRNTGIVPAVVKPVVFEDHCFIGVNSVIMPSVVVGKAAVVASGSVVVSNVPPFTMVAGNPAKIIKRFPSPDAE